jgi:hypothetical protein
MRTKSSRLSAPDGARLEHAVVVRRAGVMRMPPPYADRCRPRRTAQRARARAVDRQRNGTGLNQTSVSIAAYE